jgi:hypothetical protein
LESNFLILHDLKYYSIIVLISYERWVFLMIIDVDVFCVVLWKWRENDKIRLPYYSIVFQIACRHAKVINPKTEEQYILYYNITVFAYQTPPIRLWIWMQKSRTCSSGESNMCIWLNMTSLIYPVIQCVNSLNKNLRNFIFYYAIWKTIE